jgi:hypothetical protein
MKGESCMKKVFLITLCFLFLLTVGLPVSQANAETNTSSSMIEKMGEKSKNFSPEKFGEKMKQKADELIEATQSGSKLYIAFALIVFFALLFAGLFFKKILIYAFSFLLLAILGFFILNYWSEILDGIFSFFQWLFDKGGESGESAFSIRLNNLTSTI